MPGTLVTNEPAALSRFAAASPTGTVVKPFSTNLLYEDGTFKMGWTRRLTGADLADLRGVGVTPTSFSIGLTSPTRRGLWW